MINDKDYLNLIKKLPAYEVPPELTYNVIERCRFDKTKRTPLMLSELTYKFACMGIIAIIITVGFLNWDIESRNGVRLASNTIALADQLAYGAKVIFTGEK